ncbi:4-alpha-glucanotransferase [Ectothiorhodospira magna]|uniref:4-alpha-glucanotransferase n=1 Tax=Ectothiorhodospira magna TaxID=867345 RepID=A0A1H9BY20_9GAMM|nr:4-alpha-glucanotransferase [Ectothiorhodospira magna]SEP93657.1 4-alpha-glucanotransferase [Ectothiorhodospira magna]
MSEHVPEVRSSLDRRRAGILLHPTSLPGCAPEGALGNEAHRFIDFLAACGFTVWQVLPLNQPHEGGSPYQCMSVHAGHTGLICLNTLRQQGWLDAEASNLVESGQRDPFSSPVLQAAWRGFQHQADTAAQAAFTAFKTTHQSWLEDYVLYLGLKATHDRAPWWDWPVPLRDREPQALAAARRQLADDLEQYRFEQFLFHEQWHAVKQYANQRGILLFGDMPIFVACDSADVWSHRSLFDLNDQGHPNHVAGVPPDYFSATGQRWGNPHYRWDNMAADGFAWWIERLGAALEMVDLIRIDHFRGFEAYWSIPADEATAINGHWVPAPGRDLFAALKARFGALPLVAEDLGVITPAVEALRDDNGLPGMKILQFAFTGGNTNPYLPHRHRDNAVVYTGTHDNDTTLGWFNDCDEGLRAQVMEYLGHPTEAMPWPLVRCALASVARLAILPMQDILALDGRHRMNVPGTCEGSNWSWRFDWHQVPPGLAEDMHRMLTLYGRC